MRKVFPLEIIAWADIVKLRDNLNRLIILSIRETIKNANPSSRNYIEKFADYLINLAQARYNDEKNDAVSVITTNWDLLLDNIANNIIQTKPIPAGHKYSGVIDYCCYISSLDENDHKIKPGLYAIGKGGYNLKILKLHGSLNWLQCPKCQRLYVKFFKDWPGGYVFETKRCRHCERNFKLKKR